MPAVSTVGSVRRLWPAWFRWRGGTRLVVLSGLVGVGAGLGAVVLIEGIGLVRTLTSSISGSAGSWGPFLTIPMALWLSWRLTSWFAPEVAGHGIPQVIASLSVRGGRIRARVMPLKVIATSVTIGAGGSAGREGSIAQIGASIGSWVSRLARLGEDDVRVLVAAGAGAGISATFNAPIAGMFFAMEVILREFSLRHVHTIVVASVAGAVVSRSIIGTELTFQVPAHGLPDARQLLLHAGLGILVVILAWGYLEALDWSETVPERVTGWLRALSLGAMVALLGLLRPEVLGSGQDFAGSLLRDEVDLAWWLLILIALIKIVATAMTLGGRGSGGIFMPSLFIGAAAGSSFARLLAQIWTFSPIEPGAFALVGMAATFSAVARAPLTSILIVFEITGDYGLVLPLMVATALSTVLAGRVRPASAYEAPVERMGIHPVHGQISDLLDTVTVGDVMDASPLSIKPDATLAEVEGVLQRNRLHGLPVLDRGRLVGLIAESDVTRAGGPSDQVRVAEAMTPDPTTTTMATPVSVALERMAALGVGRLPVVDAHDTERIVGMFRREDVVTAYHRALGTAGRGQARPGRIEVRGDSEARFFETEIPRGSIADGRLVREVPWPEGCVLVAVNRGSEQFVPGGDSMLKAGDAVTAYGGPEARVRLTERLTTGGDDEATDDKTGA